MIEERVVDGRRALVAYVRMPGWVPCGRDEADLAKVIFEDGAVQFIAPPTDAARGAVINATG